MRRRYEDTDISQAWKRSAGFYTKKQNTLNQITKLREVRRQYDTGFKQLRKVQRYLSGFYKKYYYVLPSVLPGFIQQLYSELCAHLYRESLFSKINTLLSNKRIRLRGKKEEIFRYSLSNNKKMKQRLWCFLSSFFFFLFSGKSKKQQQKVKPRYQSNEIVLFALQCIWFLHQA